MAMSPEALEKKVKNRRRRSMTAQFMIRASDQL